MKAKKMRRICLTIFFYCTLSFSASCTEFVNIFFVQIDGLHQADGGGRYDKIISLINTKIPFEIRVYPPKRAFSLFDKCLVCCISPVNKNTDFYQYIGEDYIQSKPMNVAKIYIFTKPNTKVINSLEELKTLRVGARSGMPYGQKIENSGIEFKFLPTIKNNIIMVLNNRLDAFIAYVPDAYKIFEQLELKAFPHDIENPVSVHEDSLVCKKSNSTMELINDANVVISNIN
ncbi:type 2 periplasmic-binding domain-containing protein [Spartinivicinus ruber]|uniref:transporter substrate-binding domain-containing protein n=1 Tax=Spartinivicinus ruber TaxID=2683272 RepID=UPI0013CFC9E2|nr:transporter substrate-binding domain-containing protein [Spartinivicinus ruber]